MRQITFSAAILLALVVFFVVRTHGPNPKVPVAVGGISLGMSLNEIKKNWGDPTTHKDAEVAYFLQPDGTDLSVQFVGWRANRITGKVLLLNGKALREGCSVSDVHKVLGSPTSLEPIETELTMPGRDRRTEHFKLTSQYGISTTVTVRYKGQVTRDFSVY
jgi:hypothetical protein